MRMCPRATCVFLAAFTIVTYQVSLDPHTVTEFGTRANNSCRYMSDVNGVYTWGKCPSLGLNETYVGTIFEVTGVLLTSPAHKIVAKLLDLSSQTDVVVLSLPANMVMSESSIIVDTSSNASLSGTIGFEVGSFSWWSLLLVSAGFRVVNPETRLLHGRYLVGKLAHSEDCGCLCGGVSRYFSQISMEEKAQMRELKLMPKSKASCAVVINSGILGAVYSPHLGPLIDSYSYVIRLNAAPVTETYSMYVGNKTDMRIAPAFREDLLVAAQEPGPLLTSIYTQQQAHEFEEAKLRHPQLSSRTLMLHKSFRDSIAACTKNPTVDTSTGINAVAVALYLCDRVVVFGKSTWVSSLKGFPVYYYVSDIDPKWYNTLHNFRDEETLLSALSSQGYLNLVP